MYASILGPKIFDILKTIKLKSRKESRMRDTALKRVKKESKQGRMADALALRGDEGRDKLR